MTVSSEEKAAMANLLAIMNGQQPEAPVSRTVNQQALPDDTGGPGVPSQASINAMANVLESLNRVTQQVIYESSGDSESKIDMDTSKTDSGVRVGDYQITIMTDEKRIAGKQYYQISHGRSGSVIANDISLYEVAAAVAKLLNNSRYVNNFHVRRLFELDDRYTSQRLEAINFRRQQRLAEQRRDSMKSDIFTNKYEKALENAVRVKRDIKQAIQEAVSANR